MTQLHIRLTTETIEDFLTLVQDKTRCLAYSHEFGKLNKSSHFHVALETDCAMITIRKIITDKLGFSKSSYSMSKFRKTPAHVIAYLMKDGDFKNVSWPEELIAEAKTLVKQVKEKGQPKWRQVINAFYAEYPLMQKVDEDYISYSNIVSMVIHVFTKMDLRISKNEIKNISDQIFISQGQGAKMKWIESEFRFAPEGGYSYSHLESLERIKSNIELQEEKYKLYLQKQKEHQDRLDSQPWVHHGN